MFDIHTEPTSAPPRRGQILTPGLVLLHAECPDGSTWLALTTSNDVTVVDTTEVVPTGDTIDDGELFRRLVAAQQLTTERSELAEQLVQELRASIGQMRTYAIDKQREGHFCRDGLNEALAHFGMEPYEPRFTVPVTVYATVEINADSEAAAAHRVRYILDGLAYSGETTNEDLDIRTIEIDVQDAEPV
jgi:hypothetical protein